MGSTRNGGGRRALAVALVSSCLFAVCLFAAGALEAGTAPMGPGDRLRQALPTAPLPDIDAFMQISYTASPMMTEDGKTVFYTTRAGDVNQLFRLDRCAFPTQLSFFADGVSGVIPNDDLSFAVASVGEGGKENYQFHLIDLATGSVRALTNDPKVRHSSPCFSEDGLHLYYTANGVKPGDFAVYRMDLVSGKEELLLDREGSNGIGDISRDEKQLILTCANSNVDNDIVLLDLDTKKERKLTAHEGSATFYAPFFSNDDRSIFFGANDNARHAMRVEKMDVASGKREVLSDPASEWETETFALSRSQRYLAWVTNEEGYARGHLRDLQLGRDYPLPKELDGLITAIQPTDAEVVCLSFNSPTRAPDAWAYDFSDLVKGGSKPELRQLTSASYAGMDRELFRPPTLVHYASKDGTSIPAFLYLPPGYEKGHPVPFIVEVHGGPEQQFRPDFNRHFQYLMQHGFGIFAPNFRGSYGYGAEYLDADNYKSRPRAVEDVAAGAEWLIEKGYAQRGAIGIKGVSYGGYMTLAAMTAYPDLFAAGIDQAGICNFVSFLEQTADYRRALREAEYGPLSDRPFLESISPIHQTDRLKGALLVVHGLNDPRVPINEARQIIRAAQAHGTPVDSLIFPDEGHGVTKMENRLVLYRKMVEFLTRYVRVG